MGASLDAFSVSVERLKQIVGSKDHAMLKVKKPREIPGFYTPKGSRTPVGRAAPVSGRAGVQDKGVEMRKVLPSSKASAITVENDW
jgi:hypothetical protein